METDQVGPDDPLQQLAPPGQQPEELVRWEGNVQKEANLRVGQLLADHAGQQHQLIVVDPDAVVWFDYLEQGVAEAPVDPHVGLPEILVVYRVVGEIVEQRPDGVVREAVVVVLQVVPR